MSAPVRPVLVVTNHVPPDRAGAFAALHAREGIELALFGGRSHHATAGLADPGVPFRRVEQRDVLDLAGRGRYRAVVAGTAGRVALPAAWRGARRAGTPFLLWSALWAPVRTPAHVLAAPLLRAIVRDADVVVAYGPHVSRHALAQGARAVVVAPQAVDAAFWSAPGDPRRARFGGPQVAFAGRDAPEKGGAVLRAAWRASGLGARGGALVHVGAGGRPPRGGLAGEVPLGAQPPAVVRDVLAASDVLAVPSLPTRSFREPWGLVVNEAMHQGTTVLTSDAVGAAAGGLVRDGVTGLVVPAGDVDALAAALRRLAGDPGLRARLAGEAAHAVAAHTFSAWAQGFSRALAVAGVAASPC